MKYFRLTDTKDDIAAWSLGALQDPASGRPLHATQFRQGRLLDLNTPIHIPLSHPGQPLDFTEAAFAVPVLSNRAAALVRKVVGPAVQLIPALLPNPLGRGYVLNVLTAFHVLDERRAEIMRWNQDDGRPEKLGTYRAVSSPVLLAPSAALPHLSRVADWKIMLVASGVFADAVADSGLSGFSFKALPLTPPQ